MTGSGAATAEDRAARRGGILAVSLLPLVAVVGVILLALAATTPVFVAAGATLIVLSALGIGLGIAALRRSGPVAALRNTAAIVAVAGIFATLIVGATAPTGDGATGIAAAIPLMVLIAAAWVLTHLVAGAIRKAERTARA